MAKLLAFALVLAACSGSAPPSPVDAKATTGGAFGATCAVTSDTSTECTSGVCTDSIDQLGHDVCSQKCTPGTDTTCPVGASGMKCNGKGYCKP